ncbi:protein of unknown function [Xenorhabdus bovienii]|uniref:Uncharacterized protein n=1 Tax=Xenorhabdus bovienii TaxID=40576 RepID=A0A0B6XA71_XENBV|nr:protein of unknown function [Xenorhabdus bovienii]
MYTGQPLQGFLLSKLFRHTPLTYTIRVLLSLYAYTNGVLKHDIH